MVGSRVAKSWFSAMTSASVNRLKKSIFPRWYSRSRRRRCKARVCGLGDKMAGAFNLFQFPVQLGDTFSDQTPIGFDLAHRTADEACRRVAVPGRSGSNQRDRGDDQRREFDLKTTFPSSRAGAKFQDCPVRSMTLVFQAFSRLRC